MDTREYRTRTFFKNLENRQARNAWPVAIDIGYSSVKTFSGNSVSCFPAYAEQQKADIVVGMPDDGPNNSILYMGEDGEMWNVGASAQNGISVTDTTNTSMSAYGRMRYYSPMFKVIARVGIAAGLRKNQFGDPSGKEIFLETGLPPKYMQSDQQMLIESLSGHHSFKASFCGGPWEKFDFTIDPKNIGVIDQPMGTLFSVSMDKNFNLMPNAKRLFSSNILVVDPGFGTFDTFPVRKRVVSREQCETYDNLGMKQVLKETAQEVYEKYHFEIPVPAMQKYLETGTVIKREGFKTSKVPFDDILEEKSRIVCERAVKKLKETYIPTIDYDYMIVTGGTGAAWMSYIRNDDDFRGSDTLEIIAGNQGDPTLPYLLSNVRGYYIYIYGKLQQRR